MSRAARQRRFDELVAEAIDALPPRFAAVLETVPVIVLDEPTGAMLRDLEAETGERLLPDELCGLHTGVPETESSLEAPPFAPSQIHLFRRGIVALAGGWSGPDGEARVREQIGITLRHELGHQLGLDEDDLDDLGYA